MQKNVFIAFFINFLLLMVTVGVVPISFSNQVIMASLFIAFLGIPHGALDHVLFQEKSKYGPLLFYAFYLGLMIFYFIGWIFAPMVSMAIFLLISGYHFGQSQFSDISFPSKITGFLSYLMWGSSIISGLVIYNHAQIAQLFAADTGLGNFNAFFDYAVFQKIWMFTSILAALSMIILWRQRNISLKRMLYEAMTLFLIHLSFYMLPLIIGFSLYFATLHSLRVLSEEFTFLKGQRRWLTLQEFIRLLLPFSLLSVFFIVASLLGAINGYIAIPEVLLFFILLSVVTLPHAVVMEQFYEK